MDLEKLPGLPTMKQASKNSWNFQRDFKALGHGNGIIKTF